VSYTYDYPRPALTVDAVVFGFDGSALSVLLIERAEDPHAGSWAIPGGFVMMDEDLEDAARRELAEETGIERVFLEQLQSFGTPGRDPRGRVVTIAFYGLVKPSEHRVRADTDARAARWFPVDEPPSLAFDHDEMLAVALTRLRQKVRQQPVGFELLDSEFTLGQLQSLYQAVLGRDIDKRNFRRRIKEMDLLVDTGTVQSGVPHRAARLYRFDRARYEALVAGGFHFEL
jgi:8-oxo-dGTP diphosphatase